MILLPKTLTKRPVLAFGVCAALISTPSWTQTPLYSYTVPAGGYAPNSNLTTFTDSVTGTWTMQYDSLNRVQSASASAGTYQGVGLQWQYDSFGNRLSQIPSTTGASNATVPGASSPTYNSNNQMISGSVSAVTYDGGGNMTFDGAATYVAYDAENRVCATASMTNSSGVTQYIYNAEGQRVAKGYPRSNPSNVPFCPTDMSNFVVTATYILGPNGEQMTEVDGAGQWKHTNVYATGQLLATYDTIGLHFAQTDPLGTVRVQASATGVIEKFCASLPFGDGQNCTGISDPTEHHFTGKERDSESGLDYFSTRYYGSTMGRFMSPDSLLANPIRLINPQRWNMYAYVINNPLTLTDPDGRDAIAVNFSADVHGLGHMGIISLHSDGSATYSRFGPQHPGSPVDVGQVRTDTNLPKVQFDSKGQPTDASLHDLTQAVSKFEDYTGNVNMSYFKTTEAETTALDQYIGAAQAASDAHKLSYVGPFSTCVTYCAVAMHRAGVNWRAALNLSPIPNIWAANLADYADKNHTEKVTVTITPVP